MTGFGISNGLSIDEQVNGFVLSVQGRKIIEHSSKKPCMEIGSSETKIESKSGFFKIREKVLHMKALQHYSIIEKSDNTCTLQLNNMLTIRLELKDNL